MYTVSIPVDIYAFDRYGRENTLKELKRAKASRVMLAIGSYITDTEKAGKLFAKLSDECAYLKSHGFETGAWLWTFATDEPNRFVKIESPDGKRTAEVCPTDREFTAFAAEYIKRIASCGVDFILFDDDFRLGYYGEVNIGCTCKNHMRLISEIVGEKLTASDIKNYILSGGKNKYRSAFLKANRAPLTQFAAAMRKAADSVNPNVRIGVCACYTTWDIDGTDSIEISQILAGGTKPLLRLIGAPYWACATKTNLENIIEFERLQQSWCPGDIEVISEGDTYPRPRFFTPSCYLECFDTSLRADGSISGILKYMLDYVASPSYETVYIDRHQANEPVYAQIEKYFGGKTCCGIRIYEEMHKFETMEIPERLTKTNTVADIYSPVASGMFASCSIPTCYHGNGVGAVFGENARYLSENALKNGLIIDIYAAKLLNERGIDVGITDFGSFFNPGREEFIKSGEQVLLHETSARNIKINQKAIPVSFYPNNDRNVPASFCYQNSDGEKYFVLNFDAYNSGSGTYQNYERSKSAAEAYEYLSGKRLPAYSEKHPHLYIITKKNEEKSAMAVGLWNLSADSILSPGILLDESYSSANFINCSGKLFGNTMNLSDIPAFGFAGFEVKL